MASDDEARGFSQGYALAVRWLEEVAETQKADGNYTRWGVYRTGAGFLRDNAQRAIYWHQDKLVVESADVQDSLQQMADEEGQEVHPAEPVHRWPYWLCRLILLFDLIPRYGRVYPIVKPSDDQDPPRAAIWVWQWRGWWGLHFLDRRGLLEWVQEEYARRHSVEKR